MGSPMSLMPSLVRILLAAGLAIAGPAIAQESGAKSGAQDQTPTFRKTVNLVNVFFTVKDKHGALIPDLTKDHFDVVEEGQPQTIKFFTAESNLPLTLGIMIDSSLSMEKMLPEEKIVAADFLHKVLTDKDL